MVDTTNQTNLRKENIDAAVKAVALASYVLKELCTVDSSSAFTETYFRETNTELTGGSSALSATKVKGIPRLSPFPYGEVSFTKVSGVNNKYGMEGMISYEDQIMNNIPVIARTLLRIGRAPAYAVDVEIAAQMLAGAGNGVAIPAGSEFDSTTVANRDPISIILQGIQTMRADNIDVFGGDGYLCCNGTDYTNIISNAKVTNNPSFKTADVVSNGTVGQLCGLKIKVTEALEVTTPDVMYIVMGKEAMTWKEVIPLRVESILDPGIKTTIRAFEYGQCQVVVPNAICKITNTRK